MIRRTQHVLVALLALAAIGSASAQPKAPVAASESGPPAGLVAGEPARGDALDAVLSRLSVSRMRCTFAEEKRVALLKKPLRSSGVITFDKARGIARVTDKPKPSAAVLTKDKLRITKGARVEEIPLGKSKELRAFVLVFPSLLRGERKELERSFELGVYGDTRGWWALRFVPKTDGLRTYVRHVTVVGKADLLWGLEVAEASGDSTRTLVSDVVVGDQVSDEQIAAAFGGA